MPHRYLRLVGALALLPTLGLAQTPIPGKFYEYHVVARTGGSFTSLGSGPSINDAREVGFQGTTASGNGLWYGPSASFLVNFNPGESFSSSDLIGTAVQISANHQVVSQDRITTTSPATTSIRLYNAAASDSFSYIARGGPSRVYDAVFANPAVNLYGDVVFTAFHPTPTKVLGFAPRGGGTIVERTIVSGNPKPMIADDGTVVIQVGGTGTQSNNQILVYPPSLGSPIVIADTNANWISLDNDPGISRDGRVVAFQGNINGVGAAAIGTTTGPGIFLAINEGAGFGSAKILRVTGTRIEDVAADRAAVRGNYDGICDAGEICKPAAELGFDALGNPITIASYGADSRVGVVSVDFGAAGIDDDSFVVSFIATPSSASRDNPMLPGTPLLFSAQQGLWTIRVDVQHQLSGSKLRVYHPFTPIPVVQIGDRIGPDTITGIGVYDPIANAAHDEAGNIRTMRRGDHRVAFWASTNNGQIVVRGNHLDSDQDGLLDHWETTGIDMDQDGVVDLNLAAYGADPFTRDIFVQVDWVGKPGFDLFKPAGGVFSSDVAGSYSLFEANLRNAEVLSGPMYGARIDGSPPANIRAGVVPHVDAGFAIDSLLLPMSINLSGGTPRGGNYIGMPGNASVLPQVVYFGQPGVTFPGVNIRAFQDIKDNFLGTADKDARMLAFHYVVFAPFQDFQPNYPKTPSSATISTVWDASTIEVNATLAALPGASDGEFLLLTSGSASASVRQIQSTAVSGATGNAIFDLTAPLNPVPAVGDSVAFLDGSTGLSEVAFAPAPDHNSLPGNDVIVSAGSMGVLQGIPPNQCMEAETVSHELGHTLGLRHGGTDHVSHKGAAYNSVMSYSWQLVCVPVPAVPNYSQTGDTTFDDYGNLQFNFSDVLFHLSTSRGQARGEGFAADMQQQEPEQTLLDAIAKNGAIDTIPPTVVITSPAAGATVAPGGNLVVTVTATDNVQVTRVTASFDINGNTVTDVGDAVAATQTGPNTYQAVFPAVAGPAGTRSIGAIAWDRWSNSTRASININVNGVTQYLLTTSVFPSAGGTINANPSSGNGNYNSGTSVQLTAVPAAGYTFSGFSGDLTGSVNPQSVVMSAPRTVTANFVLTQGGGVPADFNGDGHVDVIWQDPVSGLAQVWFLGGAQGTTTIGAANLTASNTWRIVGVGDFNRDGRPDVVWQDPVSGAAQVWFLGGAQGNIVTGAAVLSLGNSWRIMSVADFNGDGQPDCIWQDQVTGLAQIWFMGGAQGATVIGAVNLTASNTWRIAGTGDFNGDGRPDVLWQDPVSGATQVWYLGGAQGNVVTNALNLAGSNSWRIASVADFNGDGRPDVVLQDPVSGASQVWFLGGAQGTTITGAAAFGGPNAWRIAGPR